MLKADELAIIDRAAADLGPDSYLGPWLRSIRAELASSLRSDLSPAPDLPDAAYRKAEAIIARAHDSADALALATSAKAEALIAKARHDADQIRAYVMSDLRTAAKRIGGDL
jgi:hypothetical protein